MFHCNIYINVRAKFYQEICSKIPSFLTNNDHDKLKILMEKSNVNALSRFICNIYNERQEVLYKENS